MAINTRVAHARSWAVLGDTRMESNAPREAVLARDEDKIVSALFTSSDQRVAPHTDSISDGDGATAVSALADLKRNSGDLGSDGEHDRRKRARVSSKPNEERSPDDSEFLDFVDSGDGAQDDDDYLSDDIYEADDDVVDDERYENDVRAILPSHSSRLIVDDRSFLAPGVDEPPVFHCPVDGCKAVYTRNNNMKVHLLTKHADTNPKETFSDVFVRQHKNTPKVWLCPVDDCGRSYSLKSNMLQHVKAKHPSYKIPDSAVRVRSRPKPRSASPARVPAPFAPTRKSSEKSPSPVHPPEHTVPPVRSAYQPTAFPAQASAGFGFPQHVWPVASYAYPYAYVPPMVPSQLYASATSSPHPHVRGYMYMDPSLAEVPQAPRHRLVPANYPHLTPSFSAPIQPSSSRVFASTPTDSLRNSGGNESTTPPIQNGWHSAVDKGKPPHPGHTRTHNYNGQLDLHPHSVARVSTYPPQ